jgi:hypothetical protein
MQRKSELSHYFCFAKSAEPARKCECYHPLGALTATKYSIDKRKDMQKRLQKAWNSLGCEVIDRLGQSRQITKNGAVIVSGGYQNELNYLRIKHAEVLSAQ